MQRFCSRYLLIALAAALLPTVFTNIAYPAGAKICVKSQLMHLYGNCEDAKHAEAPAERASVSGTMRASIFMPGRGANTGNIRMHHYANYGKTGGPAVFLQLESVATAKQKPVRLVMRCLDDETNLLFQFPGRRMSDVREKSELFFSVDGSDQKIVELALATGGDDAVMGIWHGYRAIGFLKKLLGGSSLQMDAWDRDDNHFRFGFDISSLAKAVEPLRRTCGW